MIPVLGCQLPLFLELDPSSKQTNVNKRNEGILFGLLNTQSLAKNRSITVSDTVLYCNSSSWRAGADWDVARNQWRHSTQRGAHHQVIRSSMLPILTSFCRAQWWRKVEKGGGVTNIHSDRFIVEKITLDVKPTTFEVLCCSLRSASVTFVHLVIYRPGTKPATDGFFDELIALLEIVGTFRNELVVTGDFNIDVNDATDWRSWRLVEILESFNLVQAVSDPTHWQGNTLDLVIDNTIRLSTNHMHSRSAKSHLWPRLGRLSISICAVRRALDIQLCSSVEKDWLCGVS